MNNWKKCKDKEFRKIIDRGRENVSILSHHCALHYRSQAEQHMFGCEEPALAGKIPLQSPVNQTEVSYSDPGVII